MIVSEEAKEWWKNIPLKDKLLIQQFYLMRAEKTSFFNEESLALNIQMVYEERELINKFVLPKKN